MAGEAQGKDSVQAREAAIFRMVMAVIMAAAILMGALNLAGVIHM